jgi:ATP phosphoribosyltransferase regulatory subunit
MNWLLPESLADALPQEAMQIERLRRQLLDVFFAHGYEFVMPPLVEYLDSLLTGAGQDLKLRTFKIVDQISGRTMGVRADTTPQVARIDAHLLNRAGVTRLCYCDSVLHAMPATMTASREPIQLGAELFGYEGIEADIEIVKLMAAVLSAAGAPSYRIDLGHVGLFRGIAEAAKLSADDTETLFALLQAKDAPSLRDFSARLPEHLQAGLLALPTLYGGAEVLPRARAVLPALPWIGEALDILAHVHDALDGLPISFDLADLRGYHYHNGLVFGAYATGAAGAIALGGRYDGIGEAFGRARPATGFSLDLRELVRLLPGVSPKGAIVAPAGIDDSLTARISALREKGEVVVQRLPGEAANEDPFCDRTLVRREGDWIIESLNNK